MTNRFKVGRLRRISWSSPLTRRLLLVNLTAPIILVMGLFLMDHYKQGLIRNELEGLTTQAEMVAGAVGEGAVTESQLGFLELNDDLAQQMVRRLSESARVRARMFDAQGNLAADSQFLLSLKGNIRIEDLPAPRQPGLTASLSYWWDKASTWMPTDDALPPFVEYSEDRADHWPEVLASLTGRSQTQVRRNPKGGIVLSVAVPVQRYKQVVGAVMVSHNGNNVARNLFQVRLAILEVFVAVLAITVALSVYMASTISRPIRHLARAADLVRTGQGRRHRIPNLSERGDEIGDLSLALAEMTAALWRRMDAIERFAADVAHEIKNPLTSVRSAVETVGRVKDPEQQKKLLSIIQDDVERLNRLISDISDASRVDAELSRADTEAVAVSTMLETLAEIYRSTNEDRPISFTVNVPRDDLLTVTGIESRLVQVLRNLIGNAISFSPPGGTIHLAGHDGGNVVHIVVEDDGPGIPEGKQDAIFERFYCERPESEKFGTHSGLGLSISKQIIDAHRGTIRVENRHDAQGRVIGARFIIALPAA